jgi:hypothetical protein
MPWVVAAPPSTHASRWPARWRAPSRISRLNRRSTTETERRTKMHLVAMPIFSLNQLEKKEQQSWRKY